MINRKMTAVVIMLLIATTLACTIPVNFAPVSEVEEKIVYVEITSTPAQEAQVENEEEQIVPETSDVVAINIDGPWTIWQGSAEQKLSIDFLQKGSEVIGNTATGGGHSLLFEGTISADGKTVSGAWESTNGTSGNFVMEFNDALNSFSGNLGGGVPFCGTRMGSSKPYPCLN